MCQSEFRVHVFVYGTAGVVGSSLVVAVRAFGENFPSPPMGKRTRQLHLYYTYPCTGGTHHGCVRR